MVLNHQEVFYLMLVQICFEPYIEMFFPSPPRISEMKVGEILKDVMRLLPFLPGMEDTQVGYLPWTRFKKKNYLRINN